MCSTHSQVSLMKQLTWCRGWRSDYDGVFSSRSKQLDSWHVWATSLWKSVDSEPINLKTHRGLTKLTHNPKWGNSDHNHRRN